MDIFNMQDRTGDEEFLRGCSQLFILFPARLNTHIPARWTRSPQSRSGHNILQNTPRLLILSVPHQLDQVWLRQQPVSSLAEASPKIPRIGPTQRILFTLNGSFADTCGPLWTLVNSTEAFRLSWGLSSVETNIALSRGLELACFSARQPFIAQDV